MRISLYPHERSSVAMERELTQPELVELLTTFNTRSIKEGPAWSPAELKRCPARCLNAGSTKAKCEGGEYHRLNENVIAHHAVVFDIDHAKEEDVVALITRLQESGLAGVIHSTFSHEPPNNCSMRVVLFPDEGIPAAQVGTVRARLQKDFDIPADPATKDLARLYYLPTARPDTKPFALPLDGTPFSLERVLQAPAQAAPATQIVSATPAPVAIDVDALRERLKAAAAATNPANRDMLGRVLAGQPLAEVGQHDVSLQRLAGLCATWFPDNTPFDAVVAVCETSLRLMGWEDGYEDCLRAFQEKYERGLDRAREYRESQRIAAEGLRTSLALSVASAAVNPLAAQVADDGSGRYTEAALAAWSLAENEWIIQKADTYFVWVNGNYLPRLRVELPNCLRRDLARSPLNLTETRADGKVKDMDVATMLAHYCTVAVDVNADLGVQRGTFNRFTGMFTEAVCPLRPLEPTYSPEVERWLQLLGGDDADRLMDWVATVTQLDRQTCALYLYGKAGSGKSLLAMGLARLWVEGPPSDMGDAIGKFNSTLAACPLVFADEALPDVRNITETLRNLIGSSTRPLRRKYMPEAALNGAVRVILAANNRDMLKPTNDMTEMDLQAVAERILYLEIPKAASEYLESLGGAEVVNAWIFEDVLAKHALWLRANRKVAPSKGRFLVMGKQNSFHARLAVNSGVANQVCEVLVKQLVAPKNKPIPPYASKHWQVGEGELFVNVNAIEAVWETHVRSGDRYSTNRLARALAAISKESIRGRVQDQQIRYSRVNVDQLYSWAEENGVATKEALREALNAPNPFATALKGLCTKAA